MSKLLENDMIRLRAPEPEDLEQFYQWENDNRVMDAWVYHRTFLAVHPQDNTLLNPKTIPTVTNSCG